jgi:hypothetical protein
MNAALKAQEVILTATGSRHAALFDAAVILAEGGTARPEAEAFLFAGAEALGLRANSRTRQAIRKGLERGYTPKAPKPPTTPPTWGGWQISPDATPATYYQARPLPDPIPAPLRAMIATAQRRKNGVNDDLILAALAGLAWRWQRPPEASNG